MKKMLVLFLVGLFFVVGCQSFPPTKTVTEGTTAAPTPTPKPRTETPNVVFYTFPDIPVPKELGFERDKSFIYETAKLKAGVLVLSGNVDMASLETYFKANMAKNGWTLVNSFKYGDIILNFTKEDRASNVRITRETFTTQVEIWVGPIEKGGSPSLMPSRGNDFK